MSLPAFVHVRAARGWSWLTHAHEMFAHARFYWLVLIVSYWLLTLLVSIVIPVAGSIAAIVLKPVFAVGFLAAAWAQERGERPRVSRLFAGFRSNLRALIALGVVYMAGLALALVVSASFDGGVLMRGVLFGASPPNAASEAAGEFQSAILVTMLCALPTLFALWFAPALIVFQDQSTLSAVVQSFRAAIANLGAVVIYALSVFLFWVVIPGMIISACVAVFGGERGVLVGVALSTPFTLSVIAIIFIADYVIYRDLFHHEEGMSVAAGPR